jgi:uncharacterized OB-fold protein
MSEVKTSPFASFSNRDFDFFYEGLERRQILIQRCDGCGALRNPPGPLCLDCGATEWTAVPASGRGKLFSYTVQHHPPLPGFATPHPVGVVELEEGVRVVAGLDGVPLQQIAIGMPLVAEFIRRSDLATFRFRQPASREEPHEPA